MWQLFIKGGPIMWPMLILSILTVGAVIERIFFLLSEAKRRDPASVQRVFGLLEQGRLDEAAAHAAHSADPVAQVIAQGLQHRDTSLTDALVEGASATLDRYNRGLVMLDTAVTLGPLLGLLGTVTGMIRAFGIVGSGEIAAQQQAITGGIAEALIAVTFGLGVAIIAIIPLNYLNARMERVRRKVESSITQVELLVAKIRR